MKTSDGLNAGEIIAQSPRAYQTYTVMISEPAPMSFGAISSLIFADKQSGGEK